MDYIFNVGDKVVDSDGYTATVVGYDNRNICIIGYNHPVAHMFLPITFNGKETIPFVGNGDFKIFEGA